MRSLFDRLSGGAVRLIDLTLNQVAEARTSPDVVWFMEGSVYYVARLLPLHQASRLALVERETIGEYDYIRGRRYGGTLHMYPPGTKVDGATVLRFIGYRLRGGLPTSNQCYYLVRCRHGTVGATHMSRLSAGARGAKHARLCFSQCYAVPMLCEWCGTSEPKRFGDANLHKACQACDRQAHRVDVYDCGKPKRTLPMQAAITAEHLCARCERWPES